MGEEWFKELAQRYSPVFLIITVCAHIKFSIFFWGLLGAKSQNIGVAAAIPPEPSLHERIHTDEKPFSRSLELMSRHSLEQIVLIHGGENEKLDADLIY